MNDTYLVWSVRTLWGSIVVGGARMYASSVFWGVYGAVFVFDLDLQMWKGSRCKWAYAGREKEGNFMMTMSW